MREAYSGYCEAARYEAVRGIGPGNILGPTLIPRMIKWRSESVLLIVELSGCGSLESVMRSS